MPRTSHPDRVDDDAPEADDTWFARAKPAAEVLPSLFGPAVSDQMLERKRGRPRSAAPKEHVNIRLDADIVQTFRLTGEGWQTRMNNALREWLNSHAMQPETRTDNP